MATQFSKTETEPTEPTKPEEEKSDEELLKEADLKSANEPINDDLLNSVVLRKWKGKAPKRKRKIQPTKEVDIEFSY